MEGNFFSVFFVSESKISSRIVIYIYNIDHICDQVWTFPTHPNKYKKDPLLDCSVLKPG